MFPLWRYNRPGKAYSRATRQTASRRHGLSGRSIVHIARFPSLKFRQKALRAKTDFLNEFNLIWPVQCLLIKYSDFQKYQITPYLLPSHPDRGALANVINVGRAAVDAEGASDWSARGGRQKRVVPMHLMLASSRWRDRPATVEKHRRGEHAISRKPLRGECRVIPV
jgi:hypothetical protein